MIIRCLVDGKCQRQMKLKNRYVFDYIWSIDVLLVDITWRMLGKLLMLMVYICMHNAIHPINIENSFGCCRNGPI